MTADLVYSCAEFLSNILQFSSPFPKHWTTALIFSSTTSKHLRLYAAALIDCLLYVYLILKGLTSEEGAGNCLEYMVWHLWGGFYSKLSLLKRMEDGNGLGFSGWKRNIALFAYLLLIFLFWPDRDACPYSADG